MRRRILIALAPLAAWVIWAGLAMPSRSVQAPAPSAAGDDRPVVRGVYHVHSRASDGTGTVGEIAAAAARAGLRFVILTDHGDGRRPASPPRYVDGVLCLDEIEISTTDGHYGALGLRPPPYPLGGEARDVVEDVARLGGFGIAAHPDSSKIALRWSEWDAPIDAIEWFNADSEWRDEARWRLLPAILQYPVRSVETVASLFDRPAALLAEWDRLAGRRRVVGLAAADAHARMGLSGKADPYDERFYVRLPSYESIFRAISTIVELPQPFSGDAAMDAQDLLRALRSGHVYTAFEGIAGPAALSFRATSGGSAARQGDALTLQRSVRFEARANVPPGGSLVLRRNGEVAQVSASGTLVWDDARPGVYRIEALIDRLAPGRPPLPWIVSNPIYVTVEAAPASPRTEPATPPVSPAGVAWPSGGWHIEKDPGSDGSFAGTAGEGTMPCSLRFALGRAGRSPFVALATAEVGPLRRASSLSFRASASRPLRLSVQVRLVDGAAERRWTRSVYLDATPRDVRVALSDMREAGTGARTRFDPSRIQALLLVIDTVNARAGDGGVVRIDDLRTVPADQVRTVSSR